MRSGLAFGELLDPQRFLLSWLLFGGGWDTTALDECPFAELSVSALDGNQLVVDFVEKEIASHKTSSESVYVINSIFPVDQSTQGYGR